MKCPHCGMNVRDNISTCGYCGEDIPQHPEKISESGPKPQVGGGAAKRLADEPDMEEEEEGGLSPYLQPGEQVLIGSLNVSVKKFFFHAYMTNRRIFLIDTQEKKLKVTAKDVPRETIAGSSIEFSESSDPVLVLSIRSADDEIKTMKIVFVQNGLDRSGEIDEWINLLHESEQPKKPQKRPAGETAEPAAPPREEPEIVSPEVAAPRRELHPARKPVKDHEKQPPVKRLISPYAEPLSEHEPEHEPPPRRAQVRQIPEPLERAMPEQNAQRRSDEITQVRKPEVQSAMKVAMKSAMKPLSQPVQRPVRREITERVVRRPVVESESNEPAPPAKRPQIYEKAEEKPVPEEVPEVPEVPQFCHNCGKKLPLEANFCPGCGTRLGQNRTLTGARFPPTHHHKKTLPADTVTERRATPPPRAEEPDEEEIEDEKPQPTKPPIKKAPKGSEMTILHKFLRR